MSMKTQIQQKIADALNKGFGLDIGPNSIHIEQPADPKNGDFTTNMAMQLAKKVEMNPRQLAEKLVEAIGDTLDVERVEIAGPGFINFYLSQRFWINSLAQEIDLKSPGYVGKKYIIEFTDPNPLKELHIGHLYQNVVGDSIARVIEAVGAEVKRADYFGDVGMHVAKALWGVIHKLQEENIEFSELAARSAKERVKFLGESYAKGATAFNEDEAAKEEMKGINKQVFIVAQKFYRERYNEDPVVDYTGIGVETKYPDDMIAELYFAGREWSLSYFDSIYERLGVKFDYYYPESIAAEIGLPIVQQGLKEGVFTESDGAVVLDKEKSGLHTRVFINSLGLPTYEAKELGLPFLKQRDYDYDHAVILVGDEIEAYFGVLLKAMELVIPDLRAKTEAKFNGMVVLPDGKMSSRTGDIVRAEDFLNDVKAMVEQAAEEQERDLGEADFEVITQAAIKYGFLKFGIEGNKEFSVRNAISFEGDTGPYLQYSYVRANSILEKVGNQEAAEAPLELNRGFDESETVLMRQLSNFAGVVQKAADDRAPNYVANYLFDLAREFNSFYANHHVVDADDIDRQLWVAITAKVMKTLRIGCDLLGIKVLDRM